VEKTYFFPSSPPPLLCGNRKEEMQANFVINSWFLS
jgi:hypothetical protein